jgi:hypothetical protein
MPRPKLRIVPLHNTLNLAKGHIDLTSGFSIDNIQGLLTAETFEPFLSKLSREDLQNLLTWDLSIIHEFESDLTLGEEEEISDLLMRLVIAAIRWIAPTQTTDTSFVQGFVDRGKPLTMPLFAAKACTSLTVPSFAARPHAIFLEDCEARMGRAVPEKFLSVVPFLPIINKMVVDLRSGIHSFVPIVVAIRLCEQAYLDFDVQLRLLKRVMALEALFSTGDAYGKRALVPRVGKFLGENAPIYPGTGASYCVRETIKDICELRNAFAHGNTVPKKFLAIPPEPAVVSVNVKSYADVLREASAVILRSSLLKIFTEGLVETFSDKNRMEVFF